MKVYLSNHHCLADICGVPYLLPYGQGIVEFERQLKLNKPAAKYWEILAGVISEDGTEYDTVVSALEKKDMPKEDAKEFLDILLDTGALRR